MLAKIKMQIEDKGNGEISYQMSSLFHGFLMERIDGCYVEELHKGGLNPFSQHLECEKGQWYWVVSTLNQEAYHHIFMPLMEDEFIEIRITKKNRIFDIKNKEISHCENHEMVERFYFGNASNYFKIRFLTPTTFKSNGEYLIFPDLNRLFKNLMRKYDTTSSENRMSSEETLEQLVRYSRITQYNLRSVSFHLEGIKIPAFMGTLGIKVTGPQSMVNLVNLLLEFGTYGGVGIKSSLGMGALELQNKKGEVSYDRKTD